MGVWQFGFEHATFYCGFNTATMTQVNDGDTVPSGVLYCKLVADDGYNFVHDTVTPNRPCVIANYGVKDDVWNMSRDTTAAVENSVYVLNSVASSVLKNTVRVHATAQLVSEITYTITQDVANATTNIDSSIEYKSGDIVNITVTPNEQCYFETPPTIEMSGTTVNMNEDENGGYYYELTMKGNAVLTARATEMESYFIETNVTNATTNISPDTEYFDGDIVRVEVTADEGYYFATAPHISYSWQGVPQTEMLLSDDEGEYKKHFYCDFAISSKYSNYIRLIANGQVIPHNDKYGIITMYNPTPAELKEIGNVRYMGGVDLGLYISSLIKVYVKIPKDKTASVVLGGYDTSVVSNVITDDIVETDCGTIDIVGKYNNLMDYQHTTVEIYLPFIGFRTLDTDKVMNETLQLIYKTNVINGDTIACIYNTTGTLIYTFNCRASFEIPYRLNNEVESTGKLAIDSNYLFGFTPFVTIRCNKEYNTANIVANDNRVATLSELQGFVTCSQVFNTIATTTEEKNEIEKLLQTGVIV